jgi:hypothetical protein
MVVGPISFLVAHSSAAEIDRTITHTTIVNEDRQEYPTLVEIIKHAAIIMNIHK